MANDIGSLGYKLFQAATELPQRERQEFIAASAGAEPEAATQAARLLHDFEDGEDREPGSAVNLPEWAHEREGSLVNDWRIEEHIKQGGFGRVYRAWRPVPAGKEEAAIKFLDMAPGEIPRFLRERQTLADLNYEDICKFIDAGTTQGGVPYMVMDYVDGLPITQYCDRHRLTIPERLRLFVKLCKAVEHAHEQRVLHRDLKPANVLVTHAGAVRVLDFGVAQLLDRERTAERLTKPGDSPWTKAYASPEQVNGDDLSFATDVYALGVLLYELVTGQRPFSDFALGGDDWMHVICQRPPRPPSQALLETSEPGSGTTSRISVTGAHSRGYSPRRLSRVLKGNLDAVILMALKKDPRHRYQRVDRLRFDVENFLEGLPVTARHSSLWERCRNWSSRHRFAAIASVAWTLWLIILLNLGLLRDFEYRDQLREEERSMQKLRYLMEDGLPSFEKALPNDPSTKETRLLAAQIHTALLQRIEAIPVYTLANLDKSLALSALQCGRQWSDLGYPAAALAVSAPILPRIGRRYEWDRSGPLVGQYELDQRDRQWRDLYTQILRQRIEMQTLLQRHAEAAEGARTLAEIESRH